MSDPSEVVTDDTPYKATEAIAYGWRKFKASPSTLLVPMIVVLVVLIAAILIAVATAIGTILCYIPGVIVGFLTMYTILFVVDKKLSAVDAIKASFELVTKNFGHTFVFWLLAAICLFIGALLCGIGLLVAAPVVLIGLAYTYRRLQGEPVAP